MTGLHVDRRSEMEIMDGMDRRPITVSAPGRICLFGEHQDYFGLPVIAAAIDLRIRISGSPRTDRTIHLDLPDIGETDSFSSGEELTYSKKRDYLRSAVNVLKRKGVVLSGGWNCSIRGTIPINSGTSSSSALVVAWIRFLMESASDSRLGSPETIAEWSFESEVAEFGEPGGKMDHYASAVGGVVNIRFGRRLEVRRFAQQLQEFVLADSLQRKNTTGTLGFIKSHVLEGLDLIRKRLKGFRLDGPVGDEEMNEIKRLPDDIRRLLGGTLKTRDLTRQGERLFEADVFDHARFGKLLTLQQEVLREDIRVSTPRLDEMIGAALEAGALGAKLNGSGQGGCVFAYCPGRAEETAEAMERLGAKPFIVHIDTGVRKES